MISLAFMTQNKKIIKFEILEKTVWYFDERWVEGLQIMPMTSPQVKLQVKKMITSRKPSISALGLLIADANLGKNKEEYDACTSEYDVADMIRRDCKGKGLVEI